MMPLNARGTRVKTSSRGFNVDQQTCPHALPVQRGHMAFSDLQAAPLLLLVADIALSSDQMGEGPRNICSTCCYGHS